MRILIKVLVITLWAILAFLVLLLGFLSSAAYDAFKAGQRAFDEFNKWMDAP